MLIMNMSCAGLRKAGGPYVSAGKHVANFMPQNLEKSRESDIHRLKPEVSKRQPQLQTTSTTYTSVPTCPISPQQMCLPIDCISRLSKEDR